MSSFPAELACLAPAFRHKIWGKETIRVKGKGRHFFSKIESATSIFADLEGQESTFTLSMLKNIAPSTPTLQKIEGSMR
jgi:hypothetical protein